MTAICLLPFIGKPFNIDDPLFVWAAKQITQHPFDPFGFSVVWYQTQMAMSEITKNPPLASYYAAMVGSWTNWSEAWLHIAFLVPAVVVVVATYGLARDFTRRPILAAALTLAAPAFLVSATSIMCDVSMLALWMLCILAWRKGLLSGNHVHFALGAVLIAACALTKYFGACLIPLLFAYSLVKQRRVGYWALYFLLPIAILAGYQMWTKNLYGRGLLLDAAEYAEMTHAEEAPSMLGGFLVGLSFTGGCMLPVLLMAPAILRRAWIAIGFALAVPGAILIAWNVPGKFNYATDSKWVVFATLVPFITGGILALALPVRDLWRHRDAEAVFLCAWVCGTFIFAAILNWTVNGRSVLPLVPAVAILIARAMDEEGDSASLFSWRVALPVAASLVVSLWLAAADMSLAGSAREMAHLVMQRTESMEGKVFFSGHWGFQYYMQELGARPLDLAHQELTTNDILVQPTNNSNTFGIPANAVASREEIEIDGNWWISPMRRELGAAFYSSFGFGPLPFAWGRILPEKSIIFRLKAEESGQEIDSRRPK